MIRNVRRAEHVHNYHVVLCPSGFQKESPVAYMHIEVLYKTKREMRFCGRDQAAVDFNTVDNNI